MFPCSFSAFVVMLMVVVGGGAVGAAEGRLESVGILAAGAGSSLAVRTSGIATLVAVTAADPRTVVIELAGIGSDRRDMKVGDGAGMISRIAIESVRKTGSQSVTRVRVSLASAYRHRVRISGNIVYVDFERVGATAPSLARAAASLPAPAPSAHVAPVRAAVAAAASPNPPKPAAPANSTRTASKASPAVPASAANNVPRNRPAPSGAAVASAARPGSNAGPQIVPPATSANDLSPQWRWLAIAEPLRNSVNPPQPLPATPPRAWVPVVLKDGTTVFSYGDHTEIDGQLTFMLPFDDSEAPKVEAVSVHASAVDLSATTLAAESVKSARYTATRGPREFADFSQEISAVLGAVPLQPTPAARVSLVEAVRQRLMDWPREHYGYRAREIGEAIGMLDPMLTQLRAAAGVNRVDLSLVAPMAPPPPPMPVSPPTLVDLLENAMRFVSLLTVPAERTAVLRATSASLARHRADLPAVWYASRQRRVTEALTSETRVDEAYRKLAAGLLERAVRAARDGNVPAITALQSDLMEQDRRLGKKRQDVVSSTMAALQVQFDAAAYTALLRSRR